jgi:2-polyprenyl-3-methyl-5-hydroxy-6-metoxy-1,4-benzoquinol methylase
MKHSQSNSVIPFKNMKILDVGCGAGFLTKSLSRLGG